ncbi:MAG: hypothetical protein QOE70_4923 [Chthoniobacter sp.]|jgi:hypothetical protein|nr:hypothetical protein [Chthoniobacter sp.]
MKAGIPQPLPEAEPRPPASRKLSSDLRELLRQAAGQAVTVEEIENLLQGRGFAMFIFILAAPFLIPAPGLSTPFGIAIALLGLRIATGQKPSLPRFILRREVQYALLARIVTRLAALVEPIEKHIKPRMHFLRQHPWMMNLIGVGIVSGGVILALPLPIPFSNGLPAVSIMFLSAGLMERDGLLVLCGYLLGLMSWVYLGFCWTAVLAGFRHFF